MVKVECSGPFVYYEITDIDIHDKDDLIILSSAITGNADIFITGDKELLDLHKVKSMKIASPRMFWEELDWVHFLKRLTTYIHITILQTTS